MKYRHGYHAGNFADVHKHVTLLALIAALQKKPKGFLYLDTHAGSGRYDLSSPGAEAAAGIGRLLEATPRAAELRAYLAAVTQLRRALGQRFLYGGSPLLAVQALRPQDRALLVELQGGEVHELREALAALAAVHPAAGTVRVVRGDGFKELRACLPPAERRGLTLIDPAYEEAADAERIVAALAECRRRFPTGIAAAWYPIKEAREAQALVRQCQRALGTPLLRSEVWLYRRDSRVALNGSGLVVLNPPHLLLERMREWLPELVGILTTREDAGSSAELLSELPA